MGFLTRIARTGWLARYLAQVGIENLVVDSSSIEVSRRRRRAKTDRMDATKLVTMLIRYHSGDRKVWHVVRIPSVEAEDGRQPHRELAQLSPFADQIDHFRRFDPKKVESSSGSVRFGL